MDMDPAKDLEDFPRSGEVEFSGATAKYVVSAETPEESNSDAEEMEQEDTDEASESDVDKEKLIESEELSEDGSVKEYEVALKYLGFGPFHILLLLVNGIALSSDAVEVLSISFVFPVFIDSNQWNVNDQQEAILGSIIFVGMLFGSFTWGGLADMIGRRTTLVLSLLVSVLFGFSSAFAPSFWMFVVFRFCSGFGVGGSLPVIFPYTSEFIRNKYRGPYLGVQAMFWMVGRVVCAAFAWAIIPQEMFRFGSQDIFSWRVFIAIAALPSLLAAIIYAFLPESPRFLLEVGKEEKAMKALRLVYKLNNFHRFDDKQDYPVKKIHLDNITSDNIGSNLRKFDLKATANRILTIVNKGIDLFRRKFLRQTLLMLVVMFCLSFGSYGITLWYPTYVAEITRRADLENLAKTCNETTLTSATEMPSICGCSSVVFEEAIVRNIQLKGWKINDVQLEDISFVNVTFDNVLFNETTFRNCNFESSTFTNLHFKDVYFEDTLFQNMAIPVSSTCLFSSGSTGLLNMTNVSVRGANLADRLVEVRQFQASLNNITSYSCNAPNLKVHCKTDDFRIYRDSFYISVAALPGNVASAIAVYVMRRNVWLAISMLASTVSVFLLYVSSSEIFVIIMLCIFTAVSTPSWNDSSLIIAEIYPTSHRTTAAGTHLLMARIGAILGTNIFGLFIRVQPSVPIILVACLFLVGTVAALGLPKTTRKTLLK